MSIQNSPAPDWLHIAYEELLWWKANAARWDNRVQKYRNETRLGGGDWCSVFAHWVMQQLGYSGSQYYDGRGPAAAVSWLGWGQEEPYPPRRGAIAILSDGKMDVPGWENVPWHHVTFVWQALGKNQIIGLGGNQGGQVKLSTYVNEVEIAFRWPPFMRYRKHPGK